MKEYGGYIELDTYVGQEFYTGALSLNCGRNCLAYLIKHKQIKNIYLPYFICSSVIDACKKENIDIVFYHIDINFHPVLPEDILDDRWVYIVNYYGQIDNNRIIEYKKLYKNLIIDNAQAFFQQPVENIDTLYTCRKFFGVPDGAYLFSNIGSEELEQDISFDRMRFILGRYEKTANEFYKDYVDNNHFFSTEQIKLMSKLTHNLLRGIDYYFVKNMRTENYNILHDIFGNINKLKLDVPQGAFMYPLYIENGDLIRKKLQLQKIYIPTLWPDVFDICDETSLEYDFAKNILPIPVDQRYNENDIKYLIEEIIKCID